MSRPLTLISFSVLLLSCGKPAPLVGKFSGDAQIKMFPAAETNAKGTVTFTTERKNRGGVDGQYYVMTVDGTPFAGPCKVTSLLDATTFPTEPTFGTDGNECKIMVDGKPKPTDIRADAKLDNGTLSVSLSSTELIYHFTESVRSPI